MPDANTELELVVVPQSNHSSEAPITGEIEHFEHFDANRAPVFEHIPMVISDPTLPIVVAVEVDIDGSPVDHPPYK